MKRLQRLGIDMQQIKAIFISHEHTDHIAGLDVLHRKYQLPVYITERTAARCNMILQQDLLRSFTKDIAVDICGLTIMPFSKSHDADDPHSFMISCEGLHIGVITDIGYACEEVLRIFKQCHAVFLEANYCEDMLANGPYPFHLKRRISSSKGHLSNSQAVQLFSDHRSEMLQLLILSHLSKNNNDPALVHNVFAEHAGEVKIVVAGRDKETELYEVLHDVRLSVPAPVILQKIKQPERPMQLSLF